MRAAPYFVAEPSPRLPALIRTAGPKGASPRSGLIYPSGHYRHISAKVRYHYYAEFILQKLTRKIKGSIL
jgi:hypothetical protein